ncbi:hypothetical protein ACHAPJ_013467 [Fusarium lateritium]
MSPIVPKLKDQSLFVGQNYINGEWIESAGGKRFNVTDPASGSLIGPCPESVAEDAHKAILKADATLPGEVLFTASFLKWFSEEAARIYGDVVSHSAPGFQVQTIKEPVGVVGLITPWNFPASMITRKLGPALAASYTAIVKTTSKTPFTANAILILGERAGIPKGVVNSVTALDHTAEIRKVLYASDVMRKISFTRSTIVGKILINQSSNTLKKLSLKLGRNAPFLVFNNANLNLAAATAITSKFKSSGQTYVYSNRIFVQKGVYKKFLRRLKTTVAKFKVKPGFNKKTTHGPLISSVAAERIDSLVQDAVKRGAKIEIGGKRRDDLGHNFYEPTILSHVTGDMRLVQEEIFGPLAPIFTFKDEDKVINISNKVKIGLVS